MGRGSGIVKHHKTKTTELRLLLVYSRFIEIHLLTWTDNICKEIFDSDIHDNVCHDNVNVRQWYLRYSKHLFLFEVEVAIYELHWGLTHAEWKSYPWVGKNNYQLYICCLYVDPYSVSFLRLLNTLKSREMFYNVANFYKW